MSLAPISVPDRQPSPRLTVNLGSNNPFRNRASSPSIASPTTSIPRQRPVSRNPFLDDSESFTPLPDPNRNMSPERLSTVDPPLTGHAAELFENLSLDTPVDKPSSSKGRRPALPRPENVPPSRPSLSDDKASSRRPARRPSKEESQSRSKGHGRPPIGDIFADPKEPSKSRNQRRPRRNSDSSLMDIPSRPIDPEAERRRRERRQRERDAKPKDGKSRSKRSNGHRLDIIDKLDVSSIYGTGLFHHDGPFDACNPHRNRKGSRAAPMQAFAKDSRNMALGGAGPNNTNIDLNLFHGRGEEGYADYASSGLTSSKINQSAAFDPTAKLEPIHGAESMGLGTSTFLEGAPASRAAIQRRESENEAHNLQNGGLQRKKSLAQKIRGINNRVPRVTSPPDSAIDSNNYFTQASPPRASGSRRPNDKNPFFQQQDYDDAYDKKGAKIQLSDDGMTDNLLPHTRQRSTSSPKAIPGETRITEGRSSSIGGGEDAKTHAHTASGSGGFINRVKSLRRPPQPKRRGTTTAAGSSP
ncbi:Pal1 cell morphology protein, variant 2 [Blastomyces dermatitidis ER-3]|uniref:Pal1 cell morphology protein n=3 Tax=Blastomyces TaxID=229219 RepID=A0A179UVG2_BLAGS|nr:hypothetical protein, variant 1 [Blastomyces gilchristii SLH14081]XP_031579308.1 uncharacterized protein BDBG_06227 [Blastomyces gilchristii SLH14081]XP_031579309.1 hypothetical protein, variant 2 [Blastomyces gilchristii SLH14081]XP_045272100.1 Pal1 cell morphology protein [Blastomyces dermatitidis ER-3]XP_045279316.1 Pal1 cell morphology protein, variant 1 [Blastomyces dermatitidis ER-3]XP_045279317.1 Pal1 cell morphology protein, variant 2 [Blastomyces dermatitidis ER-3]EGE83344.2 Pal1 